MSSEFAWNTDADDVGVSSGGVDYWAILLRRKWTVALSSFLGLILGVLYFVSTPPTFQSAAQVLIERKSPPVLPTGADQSFNRYAFLADAYKHPSVMTSPKLVSEALAKQNLAELPSLRESMSPVTSIRENLFVVATTEGVGIYDVTFSGPRLEDTGLVVNGILDQYNLYLEDTHQNVERDTRDLLVRAKSELLEQLSSKEQLYNEFRKSAPLIYKEDGQGTNLHQQRQLLIEAERSRLLLEINSVASRLDAIRATDTKPKQPETILAAAGISELEPLTSKLVNNRDQKQEEKAIVEKTVLLPLFLEEDELLARYGKDHPRVKAVRRRISSSKDFYLLNYGVDLDKPANHPQTAPEPRVLQASYEEQVEKRFSVYVESLRHELTELQQAEQRLQQMFEKEQEAAKSLTQVQIRDEAFRNDIERTQQMYEEVLDKFRKIEVVGDYDGYNFDVLARAGDGIKVAPSIKKTLPLAGLLGLLFGCGLAYLLDLGDKSFHDPVSINKELGLPVIGHIPLIDTSTSDPKIPMHPVLCTLHRPKAAEAEAIRTVRTALFFNSRGKSHQIIQVTSGRPGEGKSSISANLAITIANSGKKCLLLDADFRRPRQQSLFNLDTAAGFAAAIAGSCKLSEAIHRIAKVPNLSVMPCGERPDNPSELVSSANFPAILASLRKHYDFVVVDTPPVLAVSETSAISAQVDGVILAMRIHKESKPMAHRCLELLKESGANLIGVVVNGVGNDTAAGRYYSYGGGRYSYGAQKYGYSYGQAYGQD